MKTPDQDESKPRRRWPAYLAIALVLVLVIYPLSIGPAFAMMSRYPQFHYIFANFYTPLGMVVGPTGTDRMLSAYLRWWMSIAGPNEPSPYYIS
jgi:hypothetical protein